MANDLTKFYRETLRLISNLHLTYQISEQHRQYLKTTLMNDEEFASLLLQEYKTNGVEGLEAILIDDNTSMCSFKDLMQEPKDMRKRSQSLTLHTDCSV